MGGPHHHSTTSDHDNRSVKTQTHKKKSIEAAKSDEKSTKLSKPSNSGSVRKLGSTQEGRLGSSFHTASPQHDRFKMGDRLPNIGLMWKNLGNLLTNSIMFRLLLPDFFCKTVKTGTEPGPGLLEPRSDHPTVF